MHPKTILTLFLLLLIASVPSFSGDIVEDSTVAMDQLTREINAIAQRSSSCHKDLNRNGDARPIPAGETLTLLEAEGPGVINHFWNTVGTHDPFYNRSLIIRIYYDGLDFPSVEVPLGDFFAVGHGAQKDLTSFPVSVSSLGRSKVCYWKIPFRKSIRMTVTNEHPEIKTDSFYFYVDWHKVDELPEDTLYFHSRYRQEHPARPGNYTVLDTEGKGHYVGTVLSAHQMESGWFGEGDDFFYIDGAEEPQLRGTGTEDYFNDAWGFREFCSPYHGVSLYEGVVLGDRVTAYRWHIPDPIPFKESLHFEIEHRGSIFDNDASLASFEVGGFLERQDWYSSVAFWYQAPAVGASEAFPSFEERMPPYQIIAASDLDFKADPPLVIMPLPPALLYLPMVEKGEISFTFEIAEKGFYRLDGLFVHSLMSGVYQAFLDEEPLGRPLDFGAVGFDHEWLWLDTHRRDAVKHVLKFQGTGEHSNFRRKLAPVQDGFGIAALSILHLDAMEGFRQALKESRKD